MDIETFREYCLTKDLVTEELPFGPDTLVFKVGGKIFSLCDINTFESINLKCNPEYAVTLREKYPDTILPGYHMNKNHWNTVLTHLPDQLLLELIDHSYCLVKESLPKKYFS
ncbi:MAG: MmcQ/YjbR family DNA-binding protein [Bacteroidia bacterium]|nr:MmcQ/YjbR family DNA-binding protein [Bacteroidia bacterium]